jgi:hypothetical protein
MELGTLLFLLLVLACPLMMLFMHRGGHGGHESHAGPRNVHSADETSGTPSLDELRSMRGELDVEIARLEQAESETGPEQAEPETKSPAAA